MPSDAKVLIEIESIDQEFVECARVVVFNDTLKTTRRTLFDIVPEETTIRDAMESSACL